MKYRLTRNDNGSYDSAILAPTGGQVSRRQEMLSQDVRDVLAYGFEALGACGYEIKIGPESIHAVMMGGAHFCTHYGSDSLRYFSHADDSEWALVFPHDCDGDARRGEQILIGYKPQESEKSS